MDDDYDRIDHLIDNDPISLGAELRDALSEIARHHQDFERIRTHVDMFDHLIDQDEIPWHVCDALIRELRAVTG